MKKLLILGTRTLAVEVAAVDLKLEQDAVPLLREAIAAVEKRESNQN